MRSVPYGFCRCGCGERPKVSDRTRPERGWVKGRPRHFVAGHNNRSGMPDFVVDPFGCWEWQLSRDDLGYGRLRRKGAQSSLAHRFYFERHRGPVPNGMVLDHLCQNPRCVNPYHLEAVSFEENVRRGRGAKLTPELAREIRKSDESGPKIAQRLGVSVSTIHNVRRNKRWVEQSA